MGRQITAVALPFQVYRLTGSTLAVGLIGLVQVVPLVLCSLIGGAVADAVDRRRLLLVTTSLLALCSGLYAAGALHGHPPLAGLYAVAGVAAGLGAFDQPARSATVPNLVPRDQLPAAVTLMFGLFQVSLVAGPAVGGLLIGRAGLGAAYLVDVVSFAAALAGTALIAPQPPRHERTEPPIRAIRTGLAFARRQPAILAGFAIDLDAMIFGMPRALFPALAAGVYHTGPSGLGLLYAAPGVGAVAAILATGWLGRARRLGRVVIVSVGVWGLAIAGFGLVGSLPAGVAPARRRRRRRQRQRRLPLDDAPDPHPRPPPGADVGDILDGGDGRALRRRRRGRGGRRRFGPRVSVVSGGLLCLLGAGLVALTLPALYRFPAARPGRRPPPPAVEGSA